VQPVSDRWNVLQLTQGGSSQRRTPESSADLRLQLLAHLHAAGALANSVNPACLVAGISESTATDKLLVEQNQLSLCS
jgi:hypothetical protein